MNSVKKVLLYPFSIDCPYFEGYAWAMELAFRMRASLQLFTTISAAQNLNGSTDCIYLSLLEAHGYFLQHYQHKGIKSNEVKREACIIQGGELKEELILHLKTNPVDIVIIDFSISTGHTEGVKEIVKESCGVILLSEDQPSGDNKHHPSRADHFYDRLRRADLYKLPENFFDTLGNDLSLFNYLRKFIQRKRS